MKNPTKNPIKKVLLNAFIFVAAFAVILTVISAVAVPAPANAQIVEFPCEGVAEDADGRLHPDCDFYDLVQLIENVIQFLLVLTLPIATVSITWLGWKILNAGGNVGEIQKSKERAYKILWGFFFALTAWLIVKFAVDILLAPGSYWGII